jgi:hypothetical protein
MPEGRDGSSTAFMVPVFAWMAVYASTATMITQQTTATQRGIVAVVFLSGNISASRQLVVDVQWK